MSIDNKRGFTLVEIMIVVAVIGIVVAICIPSYSAARTASATNSCKANLRQIHGAIVAYSVDIGNNPSAMSDLIPNYLRTEPHCPYTPGTTYTINSGTASCPNVGTYSDHHN